MLFASSHRYGITRRFALSLGVTGFVLLACSHGGGAAAPARKKVEFTSVPEAEAASVTNPHDYRGGLFCQRCHVSGELEPAVDPLALCAQCHDANRMKHPFGIDFPAGAGALPLLGGKEIVCHTCHDPHDVTKYPHGLRAEYSKLCLECHKRH